TLSAPDGYEFYEWNTGAQTQSIVVEDTGTYQVWVNQGIGYMSSKPFYVDDLENVCGELSIVNNSTQLFKIFPNPARDNIFIGKSDHSTIAAVNIYNQVGEKVLVFLRIKGNLDISSLPSGMYFLEIIHDGQNTVQKLLISK
ncbi:MAG TPA: T9SS type A sorting domain-containing protein, partial [Bacteroidales bacterium]|nr:T9SS type A sorting domain-containing protein [Bacteroidales bacterium]